MALFGLDFPRCDPRQHPSRRGVGVRRHEPLVAEIQRMNMVDSSVPGSILATSDTLHPRRASSRRGIRGSTPPSLPSEWSDWQLKKAAMPSLDVQPSVPTDLTWLSTRFEKRTRICVRKDAPDTSMGR